MGQSAVTQERLNAAIEKLKRAAERGEFTANREPTTPELTRGPEQSAQATAAGGGEMLQLVVSTETLLKLAGPKTRELVISLTERE